MIKKQKIKRELADNKAINQCARQFGLVGDPTRMKICWLLCKHPELSVSEIAEILGASVSAVSHSLRRLRTHKLVKSRREHKQVFYKFANNNFNNFIKNNLINI